MLFACTAHSYKFHPCPRHPCPLFDCIRVFYNKHWRLQCGVVCSVQRLFVLRVRHVMGAFVLHLWLKLCCVCIWGVWASLCVQGYGLLTFGNLFVEWRITSRGTSCFATHTIRTRSNTSLNFNNPNWVRDFAPLIWFLWLFIDSLSLSGFL